MNTFVTNSDNSPTERITEFNAALTKYKAGKAHLESRIIASEEWWKLRNEAEEMRNDINTGPGFKAKSGWLHNVIVSKHADAMENYPEPLVLPREPGDKQEAKSLSSILPVIMDENDFESTYSDGWWKKLKHGTAAYMVTWDADKLNGMGDISIREVDILKLFWEPGVRDIQQSPYFFNCEMRNNKELETEYPQLAGKLGGNPISLSRYKYDDNESLEDKSLVVDVYYKKTENGKKVVHFCKYVGETILYSTEEGLTTEEKEVPVIQEQQDLFMGTMDAAQPAMEPTAEAPAMPAAPAEPIDQGMPAHDYYAMAPDPMAAPEPEPIGGIYEDGLYPFVFDALFPIEGSPCGYGYVDLCQNTQMQIDLMDTAMLKNMVAGATPRYLVRDSSGINREQFLNLNEPLVNAGGDFSDTSIRVLDYKPLGGSYTTMYANKINELRETSGNTETATGASAAGVTSAAGVAALQEASGKTSRDASKASYRCFRKIMNMVIERIRQFYDMPRQFRITGDLGQEKFVQYDNTGLRPQWQMGMGTTDFGFRLPQFDLKIEVARKNAYTRTAQNDLAIQLYNLGVFNPQMATQAVGLLDMMDFDGKEDLLQKVQMNGTLLQQLQQLSQYVVALLNKYEPANAPAMAQSLGLQQAAPIPRGSGGEVKSADADRESPTVEKARARANNATAAVA